MRTVLYAPKRTKHILPIVTFSHKVKSKPYSHQSFVLPMYHLHILKFWTIYVDVGVTLRQRCVMYTYISQNMLCVCNAIALRIAVRPKVDWALYIVGKIEYAHSLSIKNSLIRNDPSNPSIIRNNNPLIFSK